MSLIWMVAGIENVPNLLRHASGKTYASMKRRLERLGYEVHQQLFSPHHFGIPQKRERAYIVGSLGSLDGFSWPTRHDSQSRTLDWLLDNAPRTAKPLSKTAVEIIDTWQSFLDLFPEGSPLPSGPIWAMEFGATYPFEETTPFALGSRRLSRYKGALGVRLNTLDAKNRWRALPSYARSPDDEFPDWKVKFIRSNRELYREHKSWIDKWLPSITRFSPSHQKLEWNCKGEVRNIWHHLIQFRASGVRVKRATSAPSLVAMTTTQVPIIGWQRRYLTPIECARLQSLGSLRALPEATGSAFKALGNAVNADVAETIARQLLSHQSFPQAPTPAISKSSISRAA